MFSSLAHIRASEEMMRAESALTSSTVTYSEIGMSSEKRMRNEKNEKNPAREGCPVLKVVLDWSGARYHVTSISLDCMTTVLAMAPMRQRMKSITNSPSTYLFSLFSMFEILFGGSVMFIWILVSLPVYTAMPTIHLVFFSFVDRCRNCPPLLPPLSGSSSPSNCIFAVKSYRNASGSEHVTLKAALASSFLSSSFSVPPSISCPGAQCVSLLNTLSGASLSLRLVSPSRLAVSRKHVPSPVEEAMSARSEGIMGEQCEGSVVLTITMLPTLMSFHGTCLKSFSSGWKTNVCLEFSSMSL
mmetsp:Transcript_25669/g.52307  ORF Transcript_25669/g.52307 Transcript_25669/m.52307 type:complete len:300 (-) Transcript_25669:900-1799(-)